MVLQAAAAFDLKISNQILVWNRPQPQTMCQHGSLVKMALWSKHNVLNAMLTANYVFAK
jgi:hypothetical protein